MMQEVVIAKKYEFVPPVHSAFWPTVFRPLLRPYLKRAYGVTEYQFEGLDALRAAVREGASIVLAPNHCRPCDPMVVGVLGGEIPSPLYTMASWHLFMGTRIQAWLLRRIGAFSVYREGLDRTAIKTAIDMVAEAKRPLVVFPEGIVSRTNDRLSVLNEGPAFIARSAAKQRAKAGSSGRTLIVPVALRYRYLGSLEASVAPVLDRIETRLTWRPRPDLPLVERLRRAGNAVLGLQELQLVGEFRAGDIHERLARLVDDILVPLETEWHIKKREPDVPGRVRSLRAAILPDLVEGQIDEAERDRRWRQLASLYLAQQLSLYPPGYLEGTPSTERLLETVERLEEDLTDVATIHRPLRVTVRVGDPLEVAGDASPAAVMKDVRDRLEALLGIASTEAKDGGSHE
ncbi:MAG: 1-acyl-sn-glycerol-3-phosphate acyltransferase [Isosphaeraceae bacterium]